MKKRVKINNDKVRKLVRERLKQDGTFVHESKIDKAIRQYLNERKKMEDEDLSYEDTMSFSGNAKEAFRDMIHGLNEMIEDLRIIQTKEPDVLVDMYSDIYAEPYLEEVIANLESVINSVEFLRDLSGQDDTE